MNEFRRDPITGRWVIVSSLRDARPNHFRSIAIPDNDDGQAVCPFCAHQMDTPPLIVRYGASDQQPWQVCVVPNLYPVVHPDTQYQEHADSHPLFHQATDAGFHEVVIESCTHVTSICELSVDHVTWMLTAYRDRMRLMAERGMCFALPMKNSGAEAGASLKHTHSQIFGLPFVPSLMQAELAGAQRFAQAENRCVYCDLMEAERQDTRRLVAETDELLAWCPHASRFAFETWIAPKSHQPSFEQQQASSLEKLGPFFRLVMRQIDSHPRIAAFNYFVHSLPFDMGHQDHYHWHIEIIPRLAKAAGFEWGTGVHINTVPPEQAALELRDVR